MGLRRVLENSGIEYCFSSAGNAKKCLHALQKVSDRSQGIPPELGKTRALLDKKSRRLKGLDSEPVFMVEDVNAFIIHEILEPSLNFSVVTRGSIKMSQQIVDAADILGNATQLFEKNIAQFNSASEEAVKAAKQRVSQLNDYSSRLAESLNKLNKVLGDERMVSALNNADKLSTALELLDKLEASGRLDKIMAAMNAK